MTREFDESEKFLLYLGKATLLGEVTRAVSEELSQLYADLVFRQAGIKSFDKSDPAHQAVDRHAIGLMRKRLFEIYPELEPEFKRLMGEGQGRF